MDPKQDLSILPKCDPINLNPLGPWPSKWNLYPVEEVTLLLSFGQFSLIHPKFPTFGLAVHDSLISGFKTYYLKK